MKDSLTQPRAGSAPGPVLVSGGAGFIGSHLVDGLLALGHHVTVVDNLSTGRRINLSAAKALHGDRLRFIEAELSKALDSFGPGEQFAAFYHLAAAVGVKRVMDDPISAIDTNVHETSAALRFSHARNIPTLIASSSEVYGKPSNELFKEDDDVIYGATTMTRWSYACSKAIDEFLALAYHRQHNLPTFVVRFFNTVGPRQVGEFGMVIPRFVASALKGEDLIVHGDGQQSRCFGDVRDIAGALPRIVASHVTVGKVFNLGTDKSITIRELADLVIAVTGSSSKVRSIPYTEAFTSPGFEDLKKRRPDLSRIKAAIGFEPKFTLAQTIADVAAWMTGEKTSENGKTLAR